MHPDKVIPMRQHESAGEKTGERRLGLGEVIQELVLNSPMPAKAQADRVGVRYGYLLDAANPDREDTHFQARLIAPLTNATGNDVLIDWLARECGGVFYRLNSHVAPDALTAKSLREFGDYLKAVADMDMDRKRTKHEVAEIRIQAFEAIAAICSHVASIEATEKTA
jgi:hypothetical protein